MWFWNWMFRGTASARHQSMTSPDPNASVHAMTRIPCTTTALMSSISAGKLNSPAFCKSFRNTQSWCYDFSFGQCVKWLCVRLVAESLMVVNLYRTGYFIDFSDDSELPLCAASLPVFSVTSRRCESDAACDRIDTARLARRDQWFRIWKEEECVYVVYLLSWIH